MILGIDSSDLYLSIGLATEEGILHSESTKPRFKKNSMLHEVIDAVLIKSGIIINDIGGIAVAVGPGSFTGLRVGLAAAKGICWSLGKPLAGVSSLLAIAHCRLTDADRLLVIKDARRDEFYFAGFSIINGEIVQNVQDSVGPAEQLVPLIEQGYRPFGPGLGALSSKVQSVSFRDECELYDRDRLGGAVAYLGNKYIVHGKTLDLASSMPNYIRVPKPREWKPLHGQSYGQKND